MINPPGRLVLAGGGDAADSRPLDEQFAAWLGPEGKLLYLPVAMDGQTPSYGACLNWLTSVFHPLGITNIEMWTDLTGRDNSSLAGFAGIYIGGGNTFRLLHLLRTSGFDQSLVDFVVQGGMIYGGSAGAIIWGREIMTCAHADVNEVGLVKTQGFNLAGGYAIWCHYQPGEDSRIIAFIEQYGHPVLALSERSGLIIEMEEVRAGGYEPVICFTRGQQEIVPVGQQIVPSYS